MMGQISSNDAPKGCLHFPLAVRAAVTRSPGAAFTFEALELSEPRADEVLVRIVAVGMCHTDLSVRDGHIPSPLPAVLGHEGAGVVEAVGSAVSSVRPGDHVVLTYLSCGDCTQCRRGQMASCTNLGFLCFGGARPDGSHALSTQDGSPLHDRFFGQSSFATYAIASERNVVAVRCDAPLERLGPLGCGVLTGAGAVFNALQVGPGARFAVFGAGAVGLSAAMAAQVAGASSVVCVDRIPSRLALARELGASHVIDAREGDVAARVRDALGGGVDAALDTTGRADVLQDAFSALDQGGALAVVAINPAAGDFKLDLLNLLVGCRRVIGVIEGGGSAKALIPKLVDLHLAGRFPFDKLLRFYAIDQINQAAADSLAGETIKPVLRL